MHTSTAALALGTLANVASAFPRPAAIFARQSTTQASIPQNDPNPEERAAAVKTRAEGFVYGPSLIGEAAPFPNGTLGNALHEADMDLWSLDREEIDTRSGKDIEAIQAAITAVRYPVLLSYSRSLLAYTNAIGWWSQQHGGLCYRSL